MRKMLVILFNLVTILGHSQRVVDVDKDNYQSPSSLFYTVAGSPVSATKYIRLVHGTPYFNESYMRGKVTMSEGAVYDSVLIRLDLMDNSLQYVNKQGIEMVTVQNTIRNIILTDSVTGKKSVFEQSVFLPATNSISPGWYQLLVDGRAALYKHHVKILTENKPYGSATMEQSITDGIEYYIFFNSVFTRVKKIKEIPNLLSDKKAELNKYISAKEGSDRSDANFSSLVDYYNSLLY